MSASLHYQFKAAEVLAFTSVINNKEFSITLRIISTHLRQSILGGWHCKLKMCTEVSSHSIITLIQALESSLSKSELLKHVVKLTSLHIVFRREGACRPGESLKGLKGISFGVGSISLASYLIILS